MKPGPLRLLIAAYLAAAASAVAVSLTVGGVLAPLLTFWLGGPVVTLGMAARTARRTPAQAVDPAELALWEADRRAEAAQAASVRAAG